MQIKFNGNVDDMSATLVSAERYAMGRRTYMPSWTYEIITKNLHLLTEKDKHVMIRDIENAIDYGDECDKICWFKLLEVLKKSLESK